MSKIVISLLFFCLVSCSDHNQDQARDRADISPFMGGDKENQGFKRAEGSRKFTFPADHASHPEYQTEWWYVTGNLESLGHRKFGFQLTFFRRALNPKRPIIQSNWATNQIYMAHFSVSDIHNKKFHSFERFSRDSLALAGANVQPFKVWLLDWVIQSNDGDFFPLTLRARDKSNDDDVEINLQLVSNKPLVLQGDEGFSRKSSESDSASFYYSYTRLKAEGKIVINNETFRVNGDAWMDREWSTSALNETTSGWDWFSLQLSNDEEIMFYQLRKNNGETDLASSGTYVSKNGKVTKLRRDQVIIQALTHWQSPSGVIYPSAWKFSIPEDNITLSIEPHMNNQEINFSVRYWEGAVKIMGTVGSKKITGHGYVELSGYSRVNHGVR